MKTSEEIAMLATQLRDKAAFMFDERIKGIETEVDGLGINETIKAVVKSNLERAKSDKFDKQGKVDLLLGAVKLLSDEGH